MSSKKKPRFRAAFLVFFKNYFFVVFLAAGFFSAVFFAAGFFAVLAFFAGAFFAAGFFAAFALITACAPARRANGTRNGEQET